MTDPSEYLASVLRDRTSGFSDEVVCKALTALLGEAMARLPAKQASTVCLDLAVAFGEVVKRIKAGG